MLSKACCSLKGYFSSNPSLESIPVKILVTGSPVMRNVLRVIIPVYITAGISALNPLRSRLMPILLTARKASAVSPAADENIMDVGLNEKLNIRAPMPMPVREPSFFLRYRTTESINASWQNRVIRSLFAVTDMFVMPGIRAAAAMAKDDALSPLIPVTALTISPIMSSTAISIQILKQST